jgi:hypothetical protein
MDLISARLLTKEQAAEYCGAKSLRTFDRWRTKNLVPGPIPHLGRWDIKVLDRHIDKLSGLTELVEPSNAEDDELAQWGKQNGSDD